MIDMMLYPLLMCIPLAVLVGPVGSVLVWRRSSFLSDVIAHMGVLAFAISEITGLPIIYVSIIVSILIAIILERSPAFIPKDAWLAGVSSLGISVGLVLLSIGGGGHNFEHIFWGELFVVDLKDVIAFMVFASFLVMHLIVFWKSLMLVIFHEQLAALDGIPVRLVKMIISIVSGVVIALCLKIMGLLLTGALFVLPSIGIRFFNIAPEKHVLSTVILITLSSVLGISISVGFDVIVAPWIIIALIVLNFAAFFIKKGIDIIGEK
ncbi:MAG: metal ABC transporter permease [Candidatus Paracaedibacteraceae bacterium]|nr:metal ABC transporter permease [Candidatus Paracaedibacteraceae bacterium]